MTHRSFRRVQHHDFSLSSGDHPSIADIVKALRENLPDFRE